MESIFNWVAKAVRPNVGDGNEVEWMGIVIYISD